MGQELTIEDLSNESGLSLRTLRYYMSKGLLPGPDTAGKYASYSQIHLDHLAMIKRLKGLHLPLKEIRQLLANMTPADMRRVLEVQDEIQFSMFDAPAEKRPQVKEIQDSGSALDYIRGLEGRQNRLRSLAEPPAKPAAPDRQVLDQQKTGRGSSQNTISESESWSRIKLSEGVELNIHADQARKYRRQIEELIRHAGKLFDQGNKGESNGEKE